jgi:hypothetical protein
MRKIATYEGVVENGHVTLLSNAEIPEKTHVYVLVPAQEAIKQDAEHTGESSDFGELDNISREQIFNAWKEGRPLSQIAREIGLPINAVARYLKQQQKAYIASPRLVHPEQAKDFEMQVIDQTDADV